MKLNPRGQTLIEYASIVILIMLGMVIGKTVIDRGAKAGIKNLTESVEESETESLRQAPPGGGYTLPDCDCDPWIDGGCGPAGSCLPTERYQTRTCHPLGCETQYHIITQQCVSDSGCCTTPQLATGDPFSDCGINAATGHPAPPPDGPGPGGCPDDSGWATWQCGGTPPPPPFFGCRFDTVYPPTCHFRCQNLTSCAAYCYGPPPAPCPGPAPCFFPGDNAQLTMNTSYTLFSQSVCGSDPTRCKAYCTNGLVPTPGGTCACPDPLMALQPGCICECPSGYIWGSGSCSGAQCYRTTCGGTQCANGP